MSELLALLARTAIASKHLGLVVAGTWAPEQAAYVDDDGEPLILLPRLDSDGANRTRTRATSSSCHAIRAHERSGR